MDVVEVVVEMHLDEDNLARETPWLAQYPGTHHLWDE
jgi:hypothetical protein